MSTLLTAHSLSKSYGTQKLFQNLSFTLSLGEQIGLIGPNGAGKSTLLKILMGLEVPDGGTLSKNRALSMAYASQSPDFPPISVLEVLTTSTSGDEHILLTRAGILLGKAGFENVDQIASKLSGGWKKRLDIIRALMSEPNLLLLDEPTNHLDLEGILWLEKFLKRERVATLIVSHDRYFLENVTNKTMELNPCFPEGLFISPGSLTTFLERKEAFLEAQRQEQKGLASVLRGEIDWLRRSPKARTTKSTARVQKAHELMAEFAEVKKRNQKTKVEIAFSASERETRKLLVAKNLSKSLGGKELFKGVDITLSPGTRLGIVGKNGTGKTTLLKILSGEIAQDQGTIKTAEDLKLVYFDQHREHVPGNISLKEALSPNGDTVNVRGSTIHVNGWARKFLFSPDSLSLPVSALSGGERARILIAQLMCKPADILFLDEPTNDLDIETLEVIEESLQEFTGAVVIISHDRCLMDRVCTQILGLGAGEQQIFADYRQWERSLEQVENKKEESPAPLPKVKSEKPKKLSYREQEELKSMEQNIMLLEKEASALEAKITTESNLELYQKLGEVQAKLEQLYVRWQELLDKT